MGQGLSCRESHENGLFDAVRNGDLEMVKAMVEKDPDVLELSSGYDKLSAMHFAARHGQIEVLSVLLDCTVNPDVLNRYKQTPLMMAAMHGSIACAQKLIQAGANILMFDTLHGRTCLHYAAYYGHSDCLQTILSGARTTPVAASWGFARFVNIRDGTGSTPLHLAARQRRAECIRILLDNGALVCASTGGYGYPGSTPLHLAAQGGSLECVRALLAWGADRLQRDSSGTIPYMVALKYKHGACAALLNPSSAEPLIWPAPLKFISELNPETKHVLEKALLEANMERERVILKKDYATSSILLSDSAVKDDLTEDCNVEMCCICFDQVCVIEVQECGHQMCAHCTLALCCHNKPNPLASGCPPKAPVCPFCRSSIAKLVVVKNKIENDVEGLDSCHLKPRRSQNSHHSSEGSNSFKGLTAMGSFGKMSGRNSGRVAAECTEETEKP